MSQSSHSISIDSARLRASSSKLQIYYSLPVIGTAFLVGSLAVVQGVYAKHFGVSLAAIASILLVSRIFDAVTDPIIGIISDHYYRKFGTRKPFILVGCILLVVSGYLLHVPLFREGVTNGEGAALTFQVAPVYFLGCLLVFYAAWTLFDVPHNAWASDITKSAEDRSRIFGFRTAFAWIGISLFYAVPLLPIFETSEFTPESLSFAVTAIGGLTLALLALSLRQTPNGDVQAVRSSRRYASNVSASVAVIHGFKHVLENRPLLLFFLMYMLGSTALSGMWFTLIFIYVDIYLQQGALFAQTSLIALLLGIPTIAIWSALAVRIGKQSVIAVSLFISAAGVFGTGFLSADDGGSFPLLIVMSLTYGLGITGFTALAPSLLADIADYDRLKFGVSRAGTLFSLYFFLSKTTIAIGGAIALGIVAAFGFDPAHSDHEISQITGLKLATSWLPSILILSAIPIVVVNPITSTRHNIIRKYLDRAELRKRVREVEVSDDR